jgi:hypothetical protein
MIRGTFPAPWSITSQLTITWRNCEEGCRHLDKPGRCRKASQCEFRLSRLTDADSLADNFHCAINGEI